MQMKTQSQQDAILALKQVKKIRDKYPDDKNQKQQAELSKRYSTLVHQLPFMIRQNGLQQVLGFLKGKAANDNNCAETLLLNQLAELLNIPHSSFWDQIMQCEIDQYMFYTQRCLAIINWYKRFSDSLLDTKQQSEKISGLTS